jgi:HEAT repeat protein
MKACICEFGERGAAALPALEPLLSHENANVRWQAILALENSGIVPQPFEGVLANACEDTDADVRGAAILALEALFPGSENVGSQAAALRSDPHRLVQANARTWSLLGHWSTSSGTKTGWSPIEHRLI